MATYILTADDDTFTGTSGTDVFDGSSLGVTGGTDLLNGDGGEDLFILAPGSAGVIDGGEGIDTIQIVAGHDVYSEVQTTFSSVEILDWKGTDSSRFLRATITQLSEFETIINSADPTGRSAFVIWGARGNLDLSAALHPLPSWFQVLARTPASR